MKKKILIISGIVLVAVLVTIGLIYILKPGDKTTKAIDAVPGTPALIMETSDFDTFFSSLKSENMIYQELNIIFNFSSTSSILHCYDSINSLNSFKLIKENGKTVVCLDRSVGQLSQILYKELPDEIKDKSFSNTVSNDLKAGGSEKKREYKNVVIREYKAKNGNRFFYCVKNHLFIISFSSILIEKSIDVLEDGKTINTRDKEFAEIYGSAGKKEPANIFVNIAQLAPAIAKIGSVTASDKINNLKNYAGWISFDMNYVPEMIKLNGFIQSTDTIASFTRLLKTQMATELTCLSIIPDNTAYYSGFAFNDYLEFDKSLSSLLKLEGKDKKRESGLSDIKANTGIDPKAFYKLIDNEICVSAICPTAADGETEYFTIAGLKSQTTGILELENILKTSETKTGKKLSDFKTEIKIDDKTIIDCYKLPTENLPELLFGTLFSNCKSTYVCFIKNFMVFSGSKEALHKFAYDAFLNKTMETSIEHNLFLENFSSNSLFFAFYSFPTGHKITANLLSEELTFRINQNKASFQRIGFAGYQINTANDMLYNNFVLKHSQDVSVKPQTIWESRLENTINMKPVLVINHNDNSKEILVQDEKYILYLLSNSGRELWRLKLNEPIIGKVYQIDMYKNGKLQYLFSSANKIHIIDRLGNYIDKFPASLRSQATAPLSLFDYENNKNYRVLIPCSNKKVYLYDIDGNIVKGWDFEETENQVKTEACHYKAGAEDYIVFHDDYKCYFLNRNGESRTSFLTNFKFSEKNKIWYDNTSAKPGFVTTDSKGVIRVLNQDGTQDSLKTREFTEKHYFALEDIDSDGKADYVFADGNKLEVYNKSKKLILSFDFDAEISDEPLFYKFPSNQNKIGIVCKSVSKIYLLNADGSLFNGFPLHGLTPFSIGYLNNSANKFNLLVGGPENLLYNYEVNEY